MKIEINLLLTVVVSIQSIITGVLLNIYLVSERLRYPGFWYGGITDNLGLRVIYEVAEVAGGVKNLLQTFEIKPSQRFVVISVTASTKPDLSPKQPSLEETINSVTDVQLHVYNAATIDLLQKKH